MEDRGEGEEVEAVICLIVYREIDSPLGVVEWQKSIRHNDIGFPKENLSRQIKLKIVLRRVFFGYVRSLIHPQSDPGKKSNNVIYVCRVADILTLYIVHQSLI